MHILSEKKILETWEETTKVCLAPNPLIDVITIQKTVLNVNNLKSQQAPRVKT